ncbi:MAG: right-handed parallel beta-helix repeat-containing protein [Candidatus Methylarchaceae archaeon HK02M2]|nr:right-handed parallel beta-helix repeat-containing protein [Candidatus Methylarchaceae archaeon HK02M2]
MTQKIKTIIIATLLLLPGLLVIPVQITYAEPSMTLDEALGGGGVGGTFVLDPDMLYTGGATITADTTINGREASIDLQFESIEVDGCDLMIFNCIILNGDEGLYFHNDATGMIKQNKIVNNDEGINIEDCNIGIEIFNNIITRNYYGIEIYDSTNIVISGNTISNNDGESIEIDNYNLYYVEGEATPYEANIDIKHNKIAANNYGMEADYVDGLNIFNNMIYSTDSDSIYLSRCPTVTIENNKLLGNDYGIYCSGDYYGGGSELSPSDVSLTMKHNLISGGYDGIVVYEMYNVDITKNVIKGIDGEGIRVDRCEPLSITYNTISGTDYALEIEESDNACITHNIISENADIGLKIYLSDDVYIARNTISFNIWQNIDIEDSNNAIIEYNEIMGSYDRSIDVDDCNSLTIQYNTITDSYYSLIYWDQSSGSIIGNKIGSSNSGSYYAGIELTYCDSTVVGLTTIVGNTIQNTQYGIELYESDPEIMSNDILNNNYGIYCSGDSDPVIGDEDNPNNIIDNYIDGIYISDEPSDPIINYNNIYGNVGYGVNNYGWSSGDPSDDAQYNWWGDKDGPSTTLGDGDGEEVTEGIDFDPWLNKPA